MRVEKTGEEIEERDTHVPCTTYRSGHVRSRQVKYLAGARDELQEERFFLPVESPEHVPEPEDHDVIRSAVKAVMRGYHQ